MKKLLFGTIVLAATFFSPAGTMADVDVHIGIGLPPLISFSGPPAVIVLPDTPDVYVVPYIEVDLFFWGGWWWRPWGGRWYRSHYYDRGWVYYGGVPNFYFYVDPGWRDCFRSRNWHGHPWNHHYIPHHELQRNWKTWQANRYWEKKKIWNVQGYKPQPPKQRQESIRQRQEQYRQRPEVQRELQQQREHRVQQPSQPRLQKREPRVQYQQQPQQDRGFEPRGERSHGRDFEPRGEKGQRGSQQRPSPGKHGGGDKGHGRW